MEDVRERRFVDEVVELDNRNFVQCEFQDCELRYSGGPVGFVETGMAGCHWAFGGAAHRTINLMNSFELNQNLAQRHAAALVM